jgi:hypothetical protein
MNNDFCVSKVTDRILDEQGVTHGRNRDGSETHKTS